MNRSIRLSMIVAFLLAPIAASHPPADAATEKNITFSDISAGDNAGITYRRAPSPSTATFDAIKAEPFITAADFSRPPFKSRGAPGVALLDYDNDGDLDIYVTNGPGAPNSLYANQLMQSGTVTFVDMAASAGVALTSLDSTGVCFGDIDNDGDEDLLVLSKLAPNVLFENQGDGTFVDISLSSGVATTSFVSSTCSMGDINADGLLDLAIGKAFDLEDQIPIFIERFARSYPNELLLNQGNNTFVDISQSSGFRDIYLSPEAPADAEATVTWSMALVDIDLDGDIDIMHSDDQAAHPTMSLGGFDSGFVQFFDNDGTGSFTNSTAARGMIAGAWMSIAIGDFNSDGRLDFYSGNFGNRNYVYFAGIDILNFINYESSWFLQQPGGGFVPSRAIPGSLRNIPFGWGASPFDYDNDGDIDIISHGGLDAGLGVVTAPACLLKNDGNAVFDRDSFAFANSTDHVRRTVHGVAVGDLNNDGFDDVVSVSNFNLFGAPARDAVALGGPFDGSVLLVDNFVPSEDDSSIFVPTGVLFPDNGTLSVELSSGDNGNNWIQVEVAGTIGVTSGGTVNRDGIGAVIRVTPNQGAPVLRPVMGGSSYASQDSLVMTFGLKKRNHGTVEILWPGGVHNRLYHVPNGTRVLMPEIPCSFDDPATSFLSHMSCVTNALEELIDADVLAQSDYGWYLSSALVAYLDAH